MAGLFNDTAALERAGKRYEAEIKRRDDRTVQATPVNKQEALLEEKLPEFCKKSSTALTGYYHDTLAFLKTDIGHEQTVDDINAIMECQNLLGEYIPRDEYSHARDTKLDDVESSTSSIGGKVQAAQEAVRVAINETAGEFQKKYGFAEGDEGRKALYTFARQFEEIMHSAKGYEEASSDLAEHMLCAEVQKHVWGFLRSEDHIRLSDLRISELMHQCADYFMLRAEGRPAKESIADSQFERVYKTYEDYWDGRRDYRRIMSPNYLAGVTDLPELRESYHERNHFVPLRILLENYDIDYASAAFKKVLEKKMPLPAEYMEPQEKARYILETMRGLGYKIPADIRKHLQKNAAEIDPKRWQIIEDETLKPFLDTVGKMKAAGENIAALADIPRALRLFSLGLKIVDSLTADTNVATAAHADETVPAPDVSTPLLEHAEPSETFSFADSLTPKADPAFAETVGTRGGVEPRNPAWTAEREEEREEGSDLPGRK